MLALTFQWDSFDNDVPFKASKISMWNNKCPQMTSFMMENSLRVTFLPPILQQKFTMPAWKHHHVFTSVVGCWTSYQQRGGLARRHEYIFYYRKRQVSTLLYVPDRWTFSQRVLCFLGSGSKLWVKLHSIGLLHSKDVTTKQNADGCRDKKKMNCFEQMTNWIQISSSQNGCTN